MNAFSQLAALVSTRQSLASSHPIEWLWTSSEHLDSLPKAPWSAFLDWELFNTWTVLRVTGAICTPQPLLIKRISSKRNSKSLLTSKGFIAHFLQAHKFTIINTLLTRSTHC